MLLQPKPWILPQGYDAPPFDITLPASFSASEGGASANPLGITPSVYTKKLDAKRRFAVL